MKLTKTCCKCGKEQSYSSKGSLTRAIKKNAPCRSCSNYGDSKGMKHSEATKRKMSVAAMGNENAKGHVRSLEHRKNLSLARGGDGESFLTKPYTEGQLNSWAKKVKSTTPFCEWCYSEDDLQAHHIIPKAKFPQYALELSNGRTMCKPCHVTCHKQGGY